jgi:mercuric ion binding protein
VCPITVKKALEKVPGVSKVDVRFEKKQVLVTFDDAKTNTDALVKATMNAGFPSQPAKAAKQELCRYVQRPRMGQGAVHV